MARRGAGRLGDDVGPDRGPSDGIPRRLDKQGRPVRREEWDRERGDGRDGPPAPDRWVRDEAPKPRPPRKRRRTKPAPIDTDLVRAELAKALPAGKAGRLTDRVAEAANAFAEDRLDDARQILRPIAEEAPGAASVRELHGLTLYRLGRWRPAAKELEAFRDLTGEVDQHPVLADCYRAVGRYVDAEALWEELREASPSADLVAEGRIVAAGSLADQGRLADAIRLLEGAPRGKKARAHHIRTAYALADLHERAGDVSRARELFSWIVSVDDGFGDVSERLESLS